MSCGTRGTCPGSVGTGRTAVRRRTSTGCTCGMGRPRRSRGRGRCSRPHRSQGPIPSVTLTDEVTKEEVATREGKNSPSPRKRGDDDSPEFTRFWDIYPRKVGKGAARTAWARATRKTAPEVITDAAHAHARTWASADTEARFIPHPASWLNAERWNDTLPDVAPTGRTAEDRRRGALDWAAAQYAAERHRPPEIGAES